ncbi:hypothetical protein BCR37DRAFT_376015 [Protomyces lactucae-debilis]|uniref:Uncharacterized protein n=1 Tax=Protomyces lactucae-debilis TaxID=2754530 RepID=A0A1Y2FUA4_PROLT|nr:uncharacterized protein BCR37DRAFT_376015 [Protomyces lactucae-debilis]ORY86776.1 hypothetical protein BCR37DRAFT_376015 [Protomyces lactucae-debilis]
MLYNKVSRLVGLLVLYLWLVDAKGIVWFWNIGKDCNQLPIIASRIIEANSKEDCIKIYQKFRRLSELDGTGGVLQLDDITLFKIVQDYSTNGWQCFNTNRDKPWLWPYYDHEEGPNFDKYIIFDKAAKECQIPTAGIILWRNKCNMEDSPAGSADYYPFPALLPHNANVDIPFTYQGTRKIRVQADYPVADKLKLKRHLQCKR